MASTAPLMLPWPVIMITSRAGARVRISRISVMPSMVGIFRSTSAGNTVPPRFHSLHREPAAGVSGIPFQPRDRLSRPLVVPPEARAHELKRLAQASGIDGQKALRHLGRDCRHGFADRDRDAA